ncbi:DUF4230 domain-containing protein [Echinicola rosea]|uniref:DUF4230 domain-containing protein n=1 Tax=Echinicola rosea TaxID=1807691 RepID=A0ABQ1UUR2_9BACT|nr:DUF4230 domain-containing protein [Echinicola rosea]GGF26646.1 hypothetical protein GCM10011339_13450 [Echinicola rosea]
MRKFLFGVLIGLLAIVAYRWIAGGIERKNTLEESSSLIQQEVENVSKLIVTEGHFSQVYNYKQSEGIFGNLWITQKKALVVVNADVQIAYDLSKVKFDIDAANQTLRIKEIPAPEVKVFPDFKYYDAEGDYLNPFDADDINTIKSRVNASIRRKVEGSDLKENANRRLIAELARFYVLTNSLGWKLVYEDKEVLSEGDFQLKELH